MVSEEKRKPVLHVWQKPGEQCMVSEEEAEASAACMAEAGGAVYGFKRKQKTVLHIGQIPGLKTRFRYENSTVFDQVRQAEPGVEYHFRR